MLTLEFYTQRNSFLILFKLKGSDTLSVFREIKNPTEFRSVANKKENRQHDRVSLNAKGIGNKCSRLPKCPDQRAGKSQAAKPYFGRFLTILGAPLGTPPETPQHGSVL